KVTDSRKASVTQQFKIQVVRGATPAVRILTTTLQPATTGEEYQQGYLDAENGDAQNYHWVPLPLPPGMVCDCDSQRAKIHGVPTEIGTWVIQVSVTDGDGNTAQSVVGLQVNGSNYLKGKALKSIEPDKDYSDSIKVQGGANPVSYQLVAGTL